MRQVYHSNDSASDKEKEFIRLLKEAKNCKRCKRLRKMRKGPIILNPNKPEWLESRFVHRPAEPQWIDNVIFFNDPNENLKYRERMLIDLKILPSDDVSSTLKKSLSQIEDSEGGRKPAMAILKDGTVISKVLFLDRKYAMERYSPHFWTRYILADDIDKIQESPYRMPPSIFRRLNKTQETSMSSLEFKVFLKDSTIFACWYSAPSEFIDLPEPHMAKEIIDIEIGRELARTADKALGNPFYVYCVYG